MFRLSWLEPILGAKAAEFQQASPLFEVIVHPAQVSNSVVVESSIPLTLEDPTEGSQEIPVSQPTNK